MRATIDQAGRLVIPKPLRESVGFEPGEVEITVEGAGLHIEPVGFAELVERDGLLIVAPSGDTVTDEQVKALRDALQHRDP